MPHFQHTQEITDFQSAKSTSTATQSFLVAQLWFLCLFVDFCFYLSFLFSVNFEPLLMAVL